MPAFITQPKPIGDPSSWFGPDDYPAAAKRAGESGRVAIRLTVSDAGEPLACTVEQSSGSETLDSATCRLAMRRARFVAPRDAAGRPVMFFYPLATRWELQNLDDLDFDLGKVKVDIAKGPWLRTLSVAVVDVDERGRGLACRSGTPSVPDNEACDGFFVGREMMDPVLSGGKPVRATITLTRSIRIQARPRAK